MKIQSKSTFCPSITIKQCKGCGKVFGYVPLNSECNTSMGDMNNKKNNREFEYCESCEGNLNFKKFINQFNLFKNK